jgi:L-asparaginase
MAEPRAEKIVLITTGGRISTRDLGEGAVPKLGGRDLVKNLIATDRELLEIVEFDQVPGSEMAPDRMAGLAGMVAGSLAPDDITGVVVTHGSDSLAESAFFCYLTVESDKPVVFTESMRASTDLSWDGPMNLHDALMIARWPGAKGLGALVVMHEQVHSARFVMQSEGLGLDAFSSPACGPIGRIYNGEPTLWVKPAIARTVLKPKIDGNVATVYAETGATEQRINQVLARDNLHGLIVAGFGSGRVPHSWSDALAEAAQKGLPIVLCSRTGVGGVGDRVGFQGADWLIKQGLIPANELSPDKARVKLMLALGNGLSAPALRDYFVNE